MLRNNAGRHGLLLTLAMGRSGAQPLAHLSLSRSKMANPASLLGFHNLFVLQLNKYIVCQICKEIHSYSHLFDCSCLHLIHLRNLSLHCILLLEEYIHRCRIPIVLLDSWSLVVQLKI
jgi:hypothetical protein